MSSWQYPGMQIGPPRMGDSRRYRLEPMMTNTSVTWALCNKLLARDPEYVKAVIRSYIDVKRSHGRENWEISSKLEVIEREFPKFGQSFAEVRAETGLPPSQFLNTNAVSLGNLQRAQTTAGYPGSLNRINVAPNSNINRRVSTPAIPRPVQRIPEEGEENPPPPYTSEDPDPEATRDLQVRLAAESEANVDARAAVSPVISTHVAPSPIPPSAAGQAETSELNRPPSDPELAQAWEESQLEEAKRASLAWQKEQDDLEEAMRLSLVEAEFSAISAPYDIVGQNAHAGSSKLSVVDEDQADLYEAPTTTQYVNHDMKELMGEMGNFSISGASQIGPSNVTDYVPKSILDGDDNTSGVFQQPLVPTRTGQPAVQSKNPFLSATEREYAEAEKAALHQPERALSGGAENSFEQAHGFGSTPTNSDPVPQYAPPPGPPPPHLQVSTPPPQTPAVSNLQDSPGSRPLPPTPAPAASQTDWPSPTNSPPTMYSHVSAPSVNTSYQPHQTLTTMPSSLRAQEPHPSQPLLSPPYKPNPPLYDADEVSAVPLVQKSRSIYVPPQADEDPLEMLREFDTVFLVDDSTSMKGERWQQAQEAIMDVADIASRYDENGVDVYFLNSKRVGKQLRSGIEVEDLFKGLEPKGATPTGLRMEIILREYISQLERSQTASPTTVHMPEQSIKPMNLIVVTDGAPTDDPESVLLACAKRLDRGEYPLSQIGIQFLQIGNDSEAREALQELDDGLSAAHGVRDMVDTVPFNGEAMSAGLIIKTLLGGINRRMDRRNRV
ncbi:uncharacterized protein L203_102023 [Cryptococcus depauperatus CBS 7841]|uniref:Uncharacterized protein n=1 Tax=Cryptococcus depauperatus CBS 7841 TaxID=1295531 RepID=A0A1E3IR34_9TREE|nr:hypothetical protein L203_01276 [Cryptococcus depauperatus CBS 7841]